MNLSKSKDFGTPVSMSATESAYPLTKVKAEGKYLKGDLEVMVIPNLIKGLINTPGPFSHCEEK